MKEMINLQEDSDGNEHEVYAVVSENSHSNVLSFTMNDRVACTSCCEAVTNPVCIRCYTKHFVSWTDFHGISNTTKAEILKDIGRNASKESLNEVPCLICGNENLSLCTYCYFFMVEKIIGKEKYKLSRDIIEDFKCVFNYKGTIANIT